MPSSSFSPAHQLVSLTCWGSHGLETGVGPPGMRSEQLPPDQQEHNQQQLELCLDYCLPHSLQLKKHNNLIFTPNFTNFHCLKEQEEWIKDVFKNFLFVLSFRLQHTTQAAINVLQFSLTLIKVCPRTGHEGPKREDRYSCTLSLTLVLDGSRWLMPHPGRFTCRNYPVSTVLDTGWALGPVWTNSEYSSIPLTQSHNTCTTYRTGTWSILSFLYHVLCCSNEGN